MGESRQGARALQFQLGWKLRRVGVEAIVLEHVLGGGCSSWIGDESAAPAACHGWTAGSSPAARWRVMQRSQPCHAPCCSRLLRLEPRQACRLRHPPGCVRLGWIADFALKFIINMILYWGIPLTSFDFLLRYLIGSGIKIPFQWCKLGECPRTLTI